MIRHAHSEACDNPCRGILRGITARKSPRDHMQAFHNFSGTASRASSFTHRSASLPCCQKCRRKKSPLAQPSVQQARTARSQGRIHSSVAHRMSPVTVSSQESKWKRPEDYCAGQRRKAEERLVDQLLFRGFHIKCQSHTSVRSTGRHDLGHTRCDGVMSPLHQPLLKIGLKV